MERAIDWDVGDMSCGELLVKLRLRFRDDLSPGDTMRLHATAEGLTYDLPAWCGLTGNTLLRCAPPQFIIQKNDPEGQ